MFAAPLAIISYAMVHDHPQLVTVITEFDPTRQTAAAFVQTFTDNFARAGDATFGYRLVQHGPDGTVRDYYTEECLGSGGEAPGSHAEGALH